MVDARDEGVETNRVEGFATLNRERLLLVAGGVRSVGARFVICARNASWRRVWNDEEAFKTASLVDPEKKGEGSSLKTSTAITGFRKD